VARIKQRGVVAFTGAGIAAVVILLITCGATFSRHAACSVARSTYASSSSCAPRTRPGKESSRFLQSSGRRRVRS